MIYKLKGAKGICLVSDSLSVAGMAEGKDYSSFDIFHLYSTSMLFLSASLSTKTPSMTFDIDDNVKGFVTNNYKSSNKIYEMNSSKY